MKPIKLFLFSLLFCFVLASCSKVREVPVPLQPPLGTNDPSLPKFEAVLKDALKITIYRAAYEKSGVKEYIDSVQIANKGAVAPFTLFVPNDDAWLARGYTLEKVKALSPATCKDLLMYLIAPGRYSPDAQAPVSGGNTIYTISPPKNFEYLSDFGGIATQPNYYSINLAFVEGGEMYLNGLDIGNAPNIMHQASNGIVYIINKMPLKPTKTVCQFLTEDEHYSFYLAALRISNRIYQEYGVGISPDDKNEAYLGAIPVPFYNYLRRLSRFIPNYDKSQDNAYIVFAPDNEAFRKAGLADTLAIETYIRKSYVTKPRYREIDHAIPMFTNMDSVLNYSFFVKNLQISTAFSIQYEYSRSIMNLSNRVLYLNDMKWNSTIKAEGIRLSNGLNFYDWAYFDENIFDFTKVIRSSSQSSLLFQSEGNNITLHRSDAPQGKAANVVPEYSDINAVNGVIHRVDNLLLPTP